MAEQEVEIRRFSSKPKETPLVIEDEAGVAHCYTLRELKGEFRDKFLEVMSKKAKMGEDGKPLGMRDFRGLCSDLLSMTLYDAQGQLVPPTIVASWPSSLTDELTEMSATLSNLDREARDRAKKQSPESD